MRDLEVVSVWFLCNIIFMFILFFFFFLSLFFFFFFPRRLYTGCQLADRWWCHYPVFYLKKHHHKEERTSCRLEDMRSSMATMWHWSRQTSAKKKKKKKNNQNPHLSPTENCLHPHLVKDERSHRVGSWRIIVNLLRVPLHGPGPRLIFTQTSFIRKTPTTDIQFIPMSA